MTVAETPKNRMIFKVLILGRDPARRNGFLRAAAGERISCQLHSSIGVSLGVAQTILPSGQSVALQFWALPSDPKYDSLVKSFVKGHKVAIVIIEPGDETRIASLFRSIPAESVHSTLMVISEGLENRESMVSELEEIVGRKIDEHASGSVEDVVNMAARAVCSQMELPMIVEIPREACRTYEPEPRIGAEPHNSPEEVAEIRKVAESLGLSTSESTCRIELEEGIVEVSLLSGQVRMKPSICDYCAKDCWRMVNICIIGQDTGWSSDDLSTKALLTMAKIVALTERRLPQHVEMQLLRSTICKDFSAKEDTPAEVLETIVRSDELLTNRESLLEIAGRRVREGRLPQPLYNMLKRRLERVSTH